jgi:hypothetical protein
MSQQRLKHNALPPAHVYSLDIKPVVRDILQVGLYNWAHLTVYRIIYRMLQGRQQVVSFSVRTSGLKSRHSNRVF